jgi:hypothetical protein
LRAGRMIARTIVRNTALAVICILIAWCVA